MGWDKEEVLDKIVEHGVALQRVPSKKDIDALETVPSYNTCLRLGVSLQQVRKVVIERTHHKPCRHCSSAIPHDKRVNEFCSQSCSATFNNVARGVVNKVSESQRQLKCKNCGTELASSKSSFCSQDCHIEFKFQAKLNAWLEGVSPKVSNRLLRKFLTHLEGYNCAECDIDNWNEKPIVLEVEHVNGNSDDNSPGNVCLLCPNCHSQTPTYKAKNKGSGRHSRRLRYAEGKSY